MAITEELLDQWIKEYMNPEDLIGKNGLLNQRFRVEMCRICIITRHFLVGIIIN